MSDEQSTDQLMSHDSAEEESQPKVDATAPHALPDGPPDREPQSEAAPRQQPPDEIPPEPIASLPDPGTSGSTRVSTTWTQADWSGWSYEDGGRLYQGYTPDAYKLPNDGEEQDRLDLQHEIVNIILDGRLALAPIESPRHVLDIGAGTGIWCIDFAEQFPDSHVTGTDLALIQARPRTSNCVFVLEDSEKAEWDFPHAFDYVHLRSMSASFDDLGTVVGKAFDHMAPGGWIEFQDALMEPMCIDDSLEGTALQRWFRLLDVGGRKIGRDILKAKTYRDVLKKAGFVNVQEVKCQLPGAPWVQRAKGKQLGYFVGTACLQAVESYRKILEFSGISAAEMDELIPAVKHDLRDLSIHWYVDCYFVYGQKP